MVNKVYSNSISEFTHENGGRVLLLFLLFGFAIYQFLTSGLAVFTIICLLPFVVLFIYFAFRGRMFTFWTLIFINYFVQMKGFPLPVPMSLPNEMLELLLLALAVIDVSQTPHFERA